MQRVSRLLGILIALQGQEQTLSSLAARFSCSTKTIQRDIAALEELGVPVRTRVGIGGGVSLEPGWWLGSPNLTQEELGLLLLGLDTLPASPVRNELVAKLRTAIRPARFDSAATDPLQPVNVSSVDEVDADILAQVRSAIARELWVRISYAGSSQPGERTVMPTGVMVQQGHWYLLCLDARSEERRRFRLDRIHHLRPCLPPSNADYMQRKLAEPAPVAQAFQCVAELTPRGVWFCRDHPYFSLSLIDTRLVFSRPLSDLPYVATELLRMGTDCVVSDSPELLEEMRRQAKEVLAHLS